MQFSSIWFLFLMGFPVLSISAAETQAIPKCKGTSKVTHSDGVTKVHLSAQAIHPGQPHCKRSVSAAGVDAVLCIQITEGGTVPVSCDGSSQMAEPAAQPAQQKPPAPAVQVSPPAPKSDTPAAPPSCPAPKEPEEAVKKPHCLSQLEMASAAIKCDCKIFSKAEYKPWIESVEGEGENILAAINNAIGKCDDIKKNTSPPGLYKATQLVGCPAINISFPD